MAYNMCYAYIKYLAASQQTVSRQHFTVSQYNAVPIHYTRSLYMNTLLQITYYTVDCTFASDSSKHHIRHLHLQYTLRQKMYKILIHENMMKSLKLAPRFYNLASIVE